LPENTSISDFKSLARSISIVENESAGFEALLQGLKPLSIPVIGFTGPPGAGKSTLLNGVINVLLAKQKKIGLILVDPSSPFNLGALLGDRLRMSSHFDNPNIFIRSLASRGSLGGLSEKIIEVLEVMRSYTFDFIFVETVGVGQSEVEIAGLADTTVVVLTPESGDSVQAMKAGLMEIADIFVINKADRAEAEGMSSSLLLQLHLSGRDHIPVLLTTATEGKGMEELIETINKVYIAATNREKKNMLLAEKALRLIAKSKMKDLNKNKLLEELEQEIGNPGFNLYAFIRHYI
jgi:LAO/AO transport system kinase